MALTNSFMLVEDFGGFTRWERHRGSSPATIVILIPGNLFYRNNQSYRSDIKWMWKLLRGNMNQITIGKKGYLSLMLTDEQNYYEPGTVVNTGSFAEAELMWQWIKLVCGHSWYKQKRGQIRRLLESHDTFEEMLATVNTELIRRSDA